MVGQNFFYYLIYESAIFNFPEKRKNNLKLFLLYPPTLNIICFVEKKIFLRFCLCNFESDTVKSDCRMKYLRI